MGITIHYRGKLDDLSLIETIEDRLIDLAIALGGGVKVWRSTADDDPDRMVRGLILDIAPGLEPFCVLFSPEGWLTPIGQIKEAEQGAFAEPPFCFVKTQYGPVIGHVSVVEILGTLRDEFLPELEIHDESGYWDHRDPARLAAEQERNAQIIGKFAKGLEEHPLSSEAREDPQIVVARIERVAHLVHKTFHQQDRSDNATDQPVPDEINTDWRQEEAEWDQLQRKNVARQHRMQRRIEERLQQGDTAEQALDAAFDEEFPDQDLRRQGADVDESGLTTQPTEPEPVDSTEPDEPWLDSLPEDVRADNEPDDEDHPLLQRATGFLMRLMDDAKQDYNDRSSDLIRHACEICGGLSQALPLPPPWERDFDARGLAVVQLKRALRGAAFLRGACYSLPAAPPDKNQVASLLEEVEAIEGEIVEQLRQARPAPED